MNEPVAPVPAERLAEWHRLMSGVGFGGSGQAHYSEGVCAQLLAVVLPDVLAYATEDRSKRSTPVPVGTPKRPEAS